MSSATVSSGNPPTAPKPVSRLPAPFGIYYGWIMAGAALLMNFSVSPMNPVVFSFYIIPMGAELGWSRSQVSLALTFRLLLAGFTGPLIGRLLDRWGSRWLGMVGGIVAGISLFVLGYVQELWQLYLIFAVSGIAGLGGPGANLLTTVPVAKWFIARRGRAMAMAMVGMPMGATLWIPTTQWLLANVGWRWGWMFYGVIVTTVVSSVSALVMRRAPEDHGLRPDGAKEQVIRETQRPRPVLAETNWTLQETLHSGTFWRILGALALTGMALSGTLVHRVAFFQDQGIPLETVAAGTVFDPLTVIFSSLLFGFIGERISVRLLGLMGGLGLASSVLPMIFVGNQGYSVFLHSFLWGAAIGPFVTLNNLIWPSYFGRRFLGSIQGVALPTTIVANAVAAPAYGLLLDVGVPATMVWSLSFTLFVTTGILLSTAKPPKARQPLPAAIAA